MPVSTAAVAAKGVIIALLAKASCGKLNPTALMQPAGSAATAFGPSTLSAARTASDPPQPAQALWPKNSSSSVMFLAVTAMATDLLRRRSQVRLSQRGFPQCPRSRGWRG